MFLKLPASATRRPDPAPWGSIVVHLLLLAWLVFPRSAAFLAPVSVQRGERGSSLTPIYFDSQFGKDTASAPGRAKLSSNSRPASSHLTWQRNRNAQKEYERDSHETLDAKAEAGESLSARQLPPVGSPFGSLAQGTLYGQEIRPALPIFSPDPVFGSDELAGISSGDVVVEITINERGEIVQKIVVRSLGPALDARVLAALENWRFRPATKDGVPIPSKQDVYYHLPR
jgi:TonB family protein